VEQGKVKRMGEGNGNVVVEKKRIAEAEAK
jgi:hypothetical protein